ncbi:MAG: thiamine biosynthesis protein [Nitrospiraceae bacterium]|nr:thiamine biosynthesis protein [Nitrospiraceae bacterium]
MNTKKKHTAIALYSGGLDSTLAILAVLRQGIEVTAVKFLTHFGCDASDKSSCSKDPFSAGEKFGFEIKLSHLADKFIDIVKNPKHGHGRNMNPCIDCRILMLKEAKEFMKITNADFIITGEVVGQRPMSQMKNTLYKIDKEAGVKGLVLRPLSAKILEPTIPEINGIIEREKLYDFSGRSRKNQISLAKEFELTDYPMPAGGCLLTEPNYSLRLRELLMNNPNPTLNDLHLLRVGRHFRLSPSCKLIVGRDEKDNLSIEKLAKENDYLLTVENFGSPLALLSGEGCEEFVSLSASICARYSDAKHISEVEVSVDHKKNISKLMIEPSENHVLDHYKIELKKENFTSVSS